MEFEKLLNILSTDTLYKEPDFLKSFNYNNHIKEISSISNPLIYDKLMKYLEFKEDTNKFNEERNIYLKKLLFNQKDDNILDLFSKINISNYHNSILFTSREISYLEREENNINKAFEWISNRWMNNYLANYFFQDNFYNFITNFLQMTNYLRFSKKNLVKVENLKIYNEFLKVGDLSFKEKLDYFKKNYQRTDLMELFYDDMRKVKDDCYKELVNSSLKPNKNLAIYNKDLSNKFDLDVYYLNGEEFFAFVRCFQVERDDLSDNIDYLFSRNNRYGYSFSYISNYNISTIDESNKNVILLYDNIDYNDIIYVHHADLHTGKINKLIDTYVSQKENELTTPHLLSINTKSYNEIYIKGEKEIKPCSLVCYDEVTINDVNFAKKYHLSIVIINSKKYRAKKAFDEDYDEYSYII